MTQQRKQDRVDRERAKRQSINERIASRSAAQPTFYLNAESLFSKWGFGDGGSLWDWFYDHYDDSPDWPEDDLLYALCQAYLMPKLADAGYHVELMRIETSHNPVRAATLNGEEVDHYDSARTWIDPPIEERITLTQMNALMTRLGYSPALLRPPNDPFATRRSP